MQSALTNMCCLCRLGVFGLEPKTTIIRDVLSVLQAELKNVLESSLMLNVPWQNEAINRPFFIRMFLLIQGILTEYEIVLSEKIPFKLLVGFIVCTL